jgi:hypothetical protein
MAAVPLRSLTDPEYVLTLLTNRMSRGSRPVFLLGAGCSKQYGLPSFRELLLALWEDHLHYSGAGRSTEELREGLEKLWQALGPEDRKEVLKSYLGGIRGHECPGYLRLAGLAGQVRAIVNMNFDTLLEDALDHLEVPYRVFTSFQEPVGETLTIYKPHGSVGDVQGPTLLLPGREPRILNDLILDIAKGDLFSDPVEQEKAQELLTGNHVVALGYSGVDAKIDATLLEFPKDGDRRDFKLFIANLLPPDPRLVMAQEERGSRGLSILGEAGSFESFMEELEKALEKPPGRRIAEEPPDESAAWGTWETSTRAEKAALGQCIKLAQILGSGLAGQEMSDIDLEKHGLTVYSECCKLARLTGIRLTSPEKHVLQCAALLHDLGQLATIRVEETGGDNPNLKRLENHGETTAVLIERRVPRGSALRENLVPASYGEECRDVTVETILGAILLLCRRHTSGFPILEEEGRDEEVIVGRWPVPLRKSLLLAMFSLAEELVEDQPLPRSLGVYLDDLALMEDRTPALSWRWRRGRLQVSMEGRVLRCKLVDPAQPNLAGSFMKRILGFLERFNNAVTRVGRGSRRLDVEPEPGTRLEVDEGRVQEELMRYLRASAEEALTESATSVEPGSVGEMPALLDLLAIYTLRTGHGKPWLPIESDAVKPWLDRVCSVEEAFPRNLLHLYFRAQGRGAPSSLEKAFIAGFEEIFYPAWRFVARQWRNRTAIIPLATLCLDMGSSRFRAEALEGIPHLLEAHVDRLPDGTAHAHDECTFCTSRLLATFSNARLLFSDETLKKLAPSPGAELDQTVAGFLQHFLNRDPDSVAWWGWGGESTRLQAPDYLAWAARALARCLATDEEIRSRSGGERGWLEDLGIERSELVRLLQERWKALLAVRKEDLLSSRTEMIRTLALGRMAGAYLELETCPPEIRALAFNGSRADEYIESLGRVSEILSAPFKNEWLSERLHLMPVDLVRDSVIPDEQSTRQLVDLYLQSTTSPAWVREGPDVGSWGFESRHTEQILASLVAFWRHAFLHHDRFDAAFREALKNSPPANAPAG